jgi:hypothetical protein
VIALLKMFTTQLTGLFKRIAEKEEFSFEDGARLLSQAPIGDGYIYIFATKEMKAVEIEALAGVEQLTSARPFVTVRELTVADRVVIFTRFASDAEALVLGEQLREKGIPFVAVSTVANDEAQLAELADVHLDLALKQGLLPDELGNRYGYPSSMAALFVYHGLKFTIDEILAEYDR